MSPDLEVAIAGGIIIPVVAIAVTVFLSYKPEKIPFKLQRNDSSVKQPFESHTAIIVSHPDKTIEKCRVIYKGHELITDKNLNYETILAQGSGLFRMPINSEDEEAMIIVKNGRHTLRKEKLKNIERIGKFEMHAYVGHAPSRGFTYLSTGRGFP